jgi:hypothetical protein
MTTIPEIVSNILINLSPRDLLNCTYVCKMWKDIAIALLYETIPPVDNIKSPFITYTCDDNTDDYFENYKYSYKLEYDKLSRTLESSHYGEYVKVFYLDTLVSSRVFTSECSDTEYSVDEYNRFTEELSARILSKMPNLNTLIIKDIEKMFDRHFLEVMPDRSKHLTSVTWTSGEMSKQLNQTRL